MILINGDTHARPGSEGQLNGSGRITANRRKSFWEIEPADGQTADKSMDSGLDEGVAGEPSLVQRFAGCAD
jgi:hypothetical protein